MFLFLKQGEGSAMFILDNELEKIENIHIKYPGLAKVPIYNE